MQVNEQTDLTEKNLDRLADFLTQEHKRAGLVEQIPDGAHIFHGSYNDVALTRTNLKLASRILLGMSLGYVGEAPLAMVYEYQPGKQLVIDLSTEILKGKVQDFIETFQKQSQQEVTVKVNELLAV